jgi:gluconokinase
MKVDSTTTDTSKETPLFILGGPSGCGKSTVGEAISKAMHFEFIEGDTLHPAANIAKMSAGHPLIDADRWDWLDKVISISQDIENHRKPSGIVVTCSALKKSYRDRLRERVDEGGGQGSRLREWFVFCNLSEEESMRRVHNRPGHYMKADMVASQFRDLEVPVSDTYGQGQGGEARVYVLDVEKSIDEVNQDAIAFVKSCIDEMHTGWAD